MFIRPLCQLRHSAYQSSKNLTLCQLNLSYHRVFYMFSKGQIYLQENFYKQQNWKYKMDNKVFMHKSSHTPKIEFQKLENVDKADIMELMNHPLVRRQMPLAKGDFDDIAYQAFITAKKQLWLQHKYGPWAFIINGKFAGWGGLQFEQGDADLALVLHPNYWGLGKRIYERIIEYAFTKMELSSITILLPPSRDCFKSLLHFGFQPDGELKVEGELFLRFRLFANHDQKS